MIYIIEIPHQKRPLAWSASDYVEACEVCARTKPDRESPALTLCKDALKEWLDDNHAVFILEDKDDWRGFFGEYGPRHQRAQAHAAARDLLRHLGRGCLANS